MSLVVAKSIIVPLQTEFFALEGLSQLMKTIDRIKVKLNPDLEIRGVLSSGMLCSEKELQISDSFSLPVFGSFILNPEAEAAFLVFGISF